ETITQHVIDTVAAWVATAAMPEARNIEAHRARLSAEISGPALDIMADSALVRMSEIDSIHLGSMITPGAFVVPTALAIAAARPKVDTDALVAAIAAGLEAMVRLGETVDGPTILYRGIWPSNFAAAFGVATVAARLLGLNPQQTAHALALALTTSAPGVGNVHGPATSRWLAAGFNARQGYMAALAAGQGFVSDTGLLEGNYLGNVFGISPKAGSLTDRLGERDVVSEISFKPWCAARQTMAATQAFREIIDSGVALDAVSSVEAAVPPSFLRMVDHGIDSDRMSRLTSLPYQMAIAVLDPQATFDVGGTRKVAGAVSGLMGKIKISSDENLLQGFPAVWPARVVVHANGQRHEKLVTHIPGGSHRPLGTAGIADKFHRAADAIIGAGRVEALVAASKGMLEGRTSPTALLAAIRDACNSARG
ncbi:MAG TPA: MmgE/PrpD family protein, partial [Xanthobacteraceae bacterium]|nr:MmgE/PrpD family protein [Xanthobacteraceae bacterium]